MKTLKTNRLFWILILPLVIFSGCHSAHDYRYDPKKSLPGWGVYQEHPNFPINGYYYIDIKYIPHDMISNLEVAGLPVYVIDVYFANGIYKEFLCSAISFEQLDSNVENNLNTDDEYYGSYQISNDSLFTYDVRVYFPKKGKAPRLMYLIKNNKELTFLGFYDGWNKAKSYENNLVLPFRPLKNKPDSTNELMKDTFLQGQMRKGYEEYINRKK